MTVPAHDNRIAAMSFNALGNRIATASEKVTRISARCNIYWFHGCVLCLKAIIEFQ